MNSSEKNETLKIKLDFIKGIVELLVPVVIVLALMKG